MDYGGWYGRDNLFRELADVQFLAAMGPAGGGRNPVTSRYLRHFNLVSVAQVANKTLATIFQTMLDWHLATGGFSKEVSALSGSVIAATLDIYSASMDKLLPTPTKSHCARPPPRAAQTPPHGTSRTAPRTALRTAPARRSLAK